MSTISCERRYTDDVILEMQRIAVECQRGKLMNRSQFEIDAEVQLKVIDTALELNKLFLQAAALGLGVHLNEKREMSQSGIEIVTVCPQVFRYIAVKQELEAQERRHQAIEAHKGELAELE